MSSQGHGGECAEPFGRDWRGRGQRHRQGGRLERRADWNGNVASLNYTVRADWPPDGMAFITNGSFTMGDVADTNVDGDAAPITVYVSAFYMDQTDVTEALWQQVYNWAITTATALMMPVRCDGTPRRRIIRWWTLTGMIV